MAALCSDEELNSQAIDWNTGSRYASNAENRALYLYHKPLIL